MKAIEVRALTRTFGEVTAVRDATFEVPYGAVTGFIGGNGSGKTTTMRMIVGLTIATSGTTTVAGLPYAQHRYPRQVVGAVLDRLGAHPGVTARQHLEIVAASASVESRRIDAVLEHVGLVDVGERRVGTFSTGMKQRLGLAAAFLADPPVLLLDEPASGLDPRGVRWLRDLLRSKADDGAAVFVSTHQLAELATIVDHVVVIDDGRITANESSSSILHRTKATTLEDAVFALEPSESCEVPSWAS